MIPLLPSVIALLGCGVALLDPLNHLAVLCAQHRP
jgi:hypothetical protein